MAGKRQVQIKSIWEKLAEHETDIIINDIAQNAGNVLKEYQGKGLVPDPSYTLQLSDETMSGNNLLAFQKFFDGEFQFDIFYESRSANTKLSGIYLVDRWQFLPGLTHLQPPPLTKESPRFPLHSTSVFVRRFLCLIPHDRMPSKRFHKQSLRTYSVGSDTFMAHPS